MDLSYYKMVQNAYGAKQYKDVMLFELKKQIAHDFQETVDYEGSVKIDGQDRQLLVVAKWNTELQKIIYAYPGEGFDLGNYVEVFGSTWMITHVDADQQLLHKGIIEQCNYTLTWKSKKTKEIIKRNVIIENATQYNSGIRDQQVVTVGTGQYRIRLPVDFDTLSIKTNDRFLIGFNHEVPKAYRVTLFNDVPLVYNGKGLLEVMTVEDVLNKTRDHFEWMIADYYDVDGKQEEEPIITGKRVQFQGVSQGCLYIGDPQTILRATSIGEQGQVLSNGEYQWKVEVVGRCKPDWIRWEIAGNQVTFMISSRFLLSYLPVSILVTAKDLVHGVSQVKALDIKSR